MRRSAGHTNRDLFPGQGAGKGDADRSPGWRDHYDEINWHREQAPPGWKMNPDWVAQTTGFTTVRPGVRRKIYR